MDFYAVLAQVSELLQREGRVSYRALKVQFSLDDDQLEALKDELIEAKRLAVDERGRVLVWVGEAPPAEAVGHATAPATPQPDAQPDHLVQSAPLATTSHAPDAERRQLTVMFCDLVDSTSLAQQLDPEDYRAVVRAYQEAAVAAMQPFDGYVAQYLGDGLLVYWLSPGARRCRPAGGTGWAGHVDAMAPLNARLEPQYGVRVAVRLGLHTGVAVVGRRQWGAPGAARHGRYPQHCGAPPGPGGPQHGGAECRAPAPRVFALEDVGVHQLKGVAEPMAVCRVVGPESLPVTRRSLPLPGCPSWWGARRNSGFSCDAGSRVRRAWGRWCSSAGGWHWQNRPGRGAARARGPGRLHLHGIPRFAVSHSQRPVSGDRARATRGAPGS